MASRVTIRHQAIHKFRRHRCLFCSRCLLLTATMKSPTSLIPFILLWSLAQPGQSLATPRADSTEARNKQSAWTIEDILSWEWAGDFEISPDCRWVVWAKGVPDKEKNEWVSNLYLSSLTATQEVQLTRSPEGCSGPKWSPDGKLIAFISARPAPRSKPEADKKAQIWLMNPFGGEPWPLTEGEREVLDFDWARTNKIIFSAQEAASLYEQTNKAKKDTTQVVEDEGHEPPVRLFEIDLEHKKVLRLTDNTDRIESFWVSPDGTQVVSIHDRSLRNAYDQSLQPVTFLMDLEGHERKQLFTEAKFHIWNICWEHNSRGFYAMNAEATSPRYSYPSINELYHYSIAGGETEKVNLDWDKGLSSANLEVTSDGFVTLLADGVRPKPARYFRVQDSWRREWLSGLHSTNVFGLELGKDGQTLAYHYSTPTQPDQWYRATLNGAKIEAPLLLTAVNPSLETKTLTQSEIVHWSGALSETVEGLLQYPRGYEPGRKYPLVVDIHGGPAALFMDNWQGFPAVNHLLTDRGAFILRPNYHGSANYGLKWAESILGRLNELEIQDIEAGVDYLIGRGLADPEKLGVMGWSQGAVLTAALTVHTNRYRAAIAGDGVVDWIDYWAKSDVGGWFCGNYMRRTPLDDPALFLQTSSFYQMSKVTTPTLILFGAEDKRVPTEQGWMHYRALQQTGKADVRFVLFPGEGHGPSKLVHIRRALEEQLAWCDKYLFQNAKEDSGDLKENSPLAVALKLKGAKADGIRYGLLTEGKLIPETVQHGSVQIGRFEVTRAQFHEFDGKCVVENNHDNFPMSGVTFDEAEAYCQWLSKITGETYRLPNSSESQSLYGKSSGSENTLDYWAGGAVNPDDAERLQTQIHELPGAAPLLKEVGSFQPSVSDQPVFDLGGNVAEWTVTSDGVGKVMGSSADSTADQKGCTRSPSPQYIGFRVAKNRRVDGSSK